MSLGGDPENSRLRRACRCRSEWNTGRRQNVFRKQHEPHGSCGSPVDPLVSWSVEDPGAPVRSVMVRPDAEDGSAGGDERGRRPLRRPGDDVLRRGFGGSGTTAVEPERTGSSLLESAELSISCSSELEIAEHRGREEAADAETRHGLSVRKSLSSENPMSGSGPSESARPEGDQTVEAARNREDGKVLDRGGPGRRSLRRRR
jgi:hypothetical protein